MLNWRCKINPRTKKVEERCTKIKTNLRQTKKRKRVRNSFLVPLSADSELQVYLVDEVKDQGEA